MLLYVQSKAYPGRTFVELCKPSQTVARVRANLLHRLYEIGHANHQFRLRYKGIYLRDAYTLEEYKLLNNAVIQMIPLNDVSEWNKDMRFHQSFLSEKSHEVEDIVQVALKSEIKMLDQREKVLNAYKILVLMQIVVVFLAVFTNYWYFFFAYFFFLVVSLMFSPSFSRVGGWVGTNSVRRKEFMLGMIILCALMAGAGIALLFLNVTELTSSSYPTTRCIDATSSCFTEAAKTLDPFDDGDCNAYQDRCYESSVWTAVYFCMEIVFMFVTAAVAIFLLHNFKFTIGDYIEKYLVQTRELLQILAAARGGSVNQKRNAAFEMATMAASADDNKFQIVMEGGVKHETLCIRREQIHQCRNHILKLTIFIQALASDVLNGLISNTLLGVDATSDLLYSLEVLITLALSSDTTTQEYATEAIAECLTVPTIQDQFVSIGGMKTLTALLHVKNPRTVREAITAVSYIVSDSDDNKPAVIAEHGFDDIAHACKTANAGNRKLLSSIFLELAYFDETRATMSSRNTPAEALVHLLKRSCSGSDDLSDLDAECITLVLQTLELLVIESPTLVVGQEEMLSYLLIIPSKTVDKKIQLLATNLLLYFTQTPEACELLCSAPDLTDSFLYFAHSNDSEQLKVLANIAMRVTEPFQFREKLIDDGFQEFASYLQNASSDRETWNLADQAISNLRSKEDNSEVRKAPLRPASSASSSSSRFSDHSQRAGSNNAENLS